MLGPGELWTAGGLVELGPARQRTVLGALAVDAGRPVPVETLIDRVWDEDPPGGARAGLYSYLTRLRRILADMPVTVGRSGLILLLVGAPGTASVIAQAIDDSSLRDQEGTLAGDNTTLVLFADEERLERWLDRFRAIQSTSAPAIHNCPTAFKRHSYSSSF